LPFTLNSTAPHLHCALDGKALCSRTAVDSIEVAGEVAIVQKSYSDHEKTVITPVQLSTKTGADSFMVYLFFSLLFQNFTFISQVTRISKF
jgi:hypothetical protein